MTRINGWQCDSCKSIHKEEPWPCPGCGKEVCEDCFSSFMHCTECDDAEPDKQKLAERAGIE